MRVEVEPEDFEIEGKKGSAWLASVEDDFELQLVKAHSEKKAWKLIQSYTCRVTGNLLALFFRAEKVVEDQPEVDPRQMSLVD